MIYTKQELEEAILEMADAYGLKEGYQELIKHGVDFPSLSKNIITDMFENKFNSYYCGIGLYRAYLVIYEYRKELSKNGFVEFKK